MRLAVGDLTIDVDVPERFRCEYALNGALVAHEAATGANLVISGLQLGNRSGADAARARVAEGGAAVLHDEQGRVVVGRPGAWFVGYGTHVLVVTAKKSEHLTDVMAVLTSVGPAHDPFPEGQTPAFSDLRPSHVKWFEQRRSSLLDALSYSPESSRPAQTLDGFWNELLTEPPEEEDLLHTMLSGFTVGFGDLLVKRLGFQWVVARDEWGVSLGVVALRGTANVLIVPDSFVAKRWESRTPPFVESALRDIGEAVSKAGAAWRQ